MRTEFEFYGAEKKKKTKKKREETPRRRKSDKKCKMEGGGGEGRTNWTQDRKNDKMTNHGLKEFGKKTSLELTLTENHNDLLICPHSLIGHVTWNCSFTPIRPLSYPLTKLTHLANWKAKK